MHAITLCVSAQAVAGTNGTISASDQLTYANTPLVATMVSIVAETVSEGKGEISMWNNLIRSNRVFLAVLIAITLAGLAAVAKTYHAQAFPTVHPFVITYKVLHADSLSEEPRLVGYRVLAVRSDGAIMSANSVLDANGHIPTSRALQLKDRYVVVDPLTESVSTYEPYKPLVVATQDCGGKADSPVLGYAVERVAENGRANMREQ